MNINACPFCHSIDTQIVSYEDEGSSHVCIVCIQCEARGPIAYLDDEYNAKEYATNHWNNGMFLTEPVVTKVAVIRDEDTDVLTIRVRFTNHEYSDICTFNTNSITFDVKEFMGLTYGEALSLKFKKEEQHFDSYIKRR
jgi:hypothetical protein